MATTIESSWENERLMEENLRLRKELVDLDDWVKRVNQAAKTLDADCNGVHPTAWPKDKLEEFMRMAKMPPNA